MKEVLGHMRAHWRLLSTAAGGLLIGGFLLLYRLGSLTWGLSDHEVAQITASSSWRTIAHNPLNAPLSVPEWLLHTFLPFHGQTIIRLPNVLIGIVTLICFAYILRRWYGVRTAIYGCVLFGFSAWFLHASRLATPEVLYLAAIPVLLATHIAWQRHMSKTWMTFAALTIFVLLLYIPGIGWLVLTSFIIQATDLLTGWRTLKKWWLRVALVVLCILLVTPLGLSFWRDHDLLLTWLGLPIHFDQAKDIVRRLGDSVGYLFIRGPKDPELWLDRLPVLTIFTMVMALAGGFFYLRHILAPRTRLLIALFIVSALLFALGGPVGYSLIIPIVYLIAVGGVGYLLHEWLRVFPHNPLARSVGYSLLGLAMILTCLYNYRAYFIAWPHNVTTIATFHNPR